MDKSEWLRRYRAEFKSAADLADKEAEDCAQAVTFEDASSCYKDVPEGAAQMEMSYWD